MPRFLTDDTFDDDPAVLRAGTAAMGLYYRCGVYVARHLLDGFVPTEVAVQYGTPEWVKRLTDAGLWELAQGGQHYMPLYFAHGNPTREKVLAERAAKSERQKKWLEKKGKASSTQRRTIRPSRDASQDTTVTPSITPTLPPSLTGRKRDAPPPAASSRPDGRPVSEVLRNGVDDNHRPASPARQASAAAAARQALADRAKPP